MHPDGRAHALLFGQRSSTRRAPERTAEVYLGHTGYRVAPGHRLRLHVASSDFPVFLPHPGTAENPWDATDDAHEPPARSPPAARRRRTSA